MVTNTNGEKWLKMVAAGAIALVAAVAVLLLRQPAAEKARAEAEKLTAQNEALRKELAGMRAAMTARDAASVAAPVPVEAQPAASPALAQSAATVPSPAPVDDRVLTPTGLAKPPRNDGLMLAGTHAVPTEGGIKATMTFSPTTTDPMGIVAVVVRVPRDSESKIVQFGPSAPAMFSDLVARVSEDGKFAMFQGAAQKLESLELALAVSAPVVADVRGTCGVGPFKLDVKTTGASVQK